MFDGVRVLVTGCSGFLGPWVCKKLISARAIVIGGDIVFPSQSRIHELSNQMQLLRLDIVDMEQVQQVIVTNGIEFVFHLAAQALVGVALQDPLTTISTNVMGTANILEVARHLSTGSYALKGILVASSDKAYGDQINLPYFEDAPMMGRFPYDVSKSCADLITRSYFHSYALPVAVTRCGNLYGGGDINWSRIVPGTIRSLLEGAPPIIRSDGTLVRDYIYVEDAADAAILVGEALMRDDTINGEAFNISNDSPMSVIQVVDAIRDVMGISDLTAVIENTARGEIKEQFLSSQHLRDKLNWEPKIGFRKGLEHAVDWYRSWHAASVAVKGPMD
ncbi:MAG: GDP-mannose 4,6-dehydratase [Candidatus Obscuribacterales bacterium]|nr:GDP-mannose 4,6-dehydratase [Candidatus Obscuribacterales bacterium]